MLDLCYHNASYGKSLFLKKGPLKMSQIFTNYLIGIKYFISLRMSLDSILIFALIFDSSYREVFSKRDCSVTLVENLKKWLSRRSFFGKVES